MALAGCHQPANRPVSLRGTYGVQEGPDLTPVLKVDETKTGYAFEERITGEWRMDLAIPHVATEVEVRKALGPSDIPVFGLANDETLLLKVPPGWKNQTGFVTGSGYVLVSGGRLQEARKVELGSR